MNDKFDNQDLEQFFQNNLDQYGDEPGEAFWTELEPLIPPPPKKRRRGLLLWWFLGGLLLVATGSYVWSNQKSLSVLEEKMLTQQEEIKALKVEKENAHEINTSLTASDQAILNASDQKETKLEVLEAQSNTTLKVPPSQPKKSLNNADQSKGFPSTPDFISTVQDLAKKEEDFSTQTPLKNEEAEEKLLPAEQPLLLEKIDLLAIKWDSLVAQEKEAQPVLPPPMIPTKWTPQLGIGVFYENWIWTSKNDGPGTDIPSPNFAIGASFNGQAFGLDLQIPWTEKWQLQTGLGMTLFTAKSLTGKNLVIDLDGAEIRGGNTLFNNYFYNIESILGRTQYATGISYRLNDDPLNNPMQGDTFAIKVTEHARLNYLYLPLHLNYLFEKRKWGGKLGLGLDVYHLIKVDLESSATSGLSDGESFIVENIVASKDVRLVGLRNVFLGTRVSFGLNYKLMKNWKLNLDSGFHLGVRNIAERDWPEHFSGGINVKFNYLALKMGVNYQF